jgi:hypothetical protein
MISFSFDSSGLEIALERLAQETKTDVGKIIKEEAKYLIKTVINFTPPKTRKQGVGAVRNDLGKVAAVLDYNKLKAKATSGGFYRSMAEMVKKRETEKLNKLLATSKMTFWGGRQIIASYDQLSATHRKMRNSYGRIGKEANNATYAPEMKALRKDTENKIGYAAAGWIPAAKATGAPYKKFAERTGVFGFGNGIVSYNFNAKDPYFKATNRNIKIPGYQRMIDGAVASRYLTTLKKIKRAMQGKAVNLGFTRTG